jgi:hypothetical protein
MRARTAIAWTSRRVRLTAVGWGLTTMLACVALSACTSGSATTPPPSTFVPSAGASSTPPASTFSPSAGASSTATGTAGGTSPRTSASASTSASSSASASTSASASASQSASPQPSSSPSSSPAPIGAPVTGGGGTAGFQDAGLAVLGGGAIVAGLGSIVYRRRMTKHR